MARSGVGFKTSLAILAILLGAAPVRAQSVDARVVQKTIDSAVRFLFRSQRDDGGWPEFDANYPDGVTSLVTLALLNSGLSTDHPALSKALQYMSERELEKTYTVALQTMAFCAANPNRHANRIKRNTLWLIKAQLPNGGWGYGQDRGGGGDPSNSQFALLALHEAQRVGVRFSDDTWKKVFVKARKYWTDIQNRDGSFSYSGGKGSGSMTCAGIASLIIVGSQLDGQESSADRTIRCCGEGDSNQDRIERALDWLGRNFSVHSNPGEPRYQLYYIYALERVGRLSGRRFIGDADWYREGADMLSNVQRALRSGKIIAQNTTYQGNDYSETAFALLFLSKGKRQTIINRLKYESRRAAGDVEDWNHHSVAMQHMTAHTEKAWKRDLSWQNIDLSKSRVEDLLETPVLFMSGTQVPELTRAHKQLLKEYVEQGGFLFVESCQGNGCNGRPFEEYFRKLVVELFDQPLERLPPDHPIWFAESRVLPEDLPSDAWLYGVQTCCRLGVVYAPFSLTCRWELNLPYGAKPDFNARVQSELDAATKIGLNVLAYATGKDLKEKLDTVTVLEEVRTLTPTDRGVFLLPTLRHNAGYDDAAHTISNLIQWLDQANPFQLSGEKRVIGITADELRQYPVVFMHGRGELRLTQDQRDALKEYFDDGGFLFADAICADEQFAKSFRQEMETIVGEPMGNLDESHPMLAADYYGFNVRSVSVIDPDQSGENIVSSQRKIAPRLEVAKVKNRISVVFSPLDLSCALESRHSLQCRGYVREDAARLGINIILFALQQ